MQVVRDLPEDAWQAFVANHPQANIFHTPEMFKVYLQAKFHEPELWAVVHGDQVQALMLPVRVHLFNGLIARQLTTRSIVYGGVLAGKGKLGEKGLELLLSEYARKGRAKAVFTEIRNVADSLVIQSILQHHGFVFENHVNFLIDLNRSPKEVFGSIGPRTRKNIRNALNKGKVKIEVVNDKDGLRECYQLLKKTYCTARVPLAHLSLFEAAADTLLPKNMIRISLARIDSQPAALSIDLLFKGIILGWYGGVDRAYGSYIPNDVLTWEILNWGAANGFSSYDFGGAGRPDQDYGVRHFKAKFGGQTVLYGRNTYIHSRFIHCLSTVGYKILRPVLFGRRIENKVGPQ